MAIFTLTDIIFGNKTGTAGTSQLVGGKYEQNTYRFPQDLGSAGRGHYMVIHINVQEKTQYLADEVQGDDPTIIANRKNFNTPSLNNAVMNISNNVDVQQAYTTMANQLVDAANGDSAVAKLYQSASSTSVGQFVNGALSGLGGALSAGLKNYANIKGARTIYRTTDTIALYMPDTLNFTNQQNYSDLSLTGMAAGLTAAGGSAAQTILNGGSAGNVGEAIAKNLSPYLFGYALNKLGDFGKSAFATMTGMVENPMLELLYTSPAFRQFRFDFMFYPKSEAEATEVQQILQRLKFHQAPELKKEFNGFYLVPPSEFDIKFYYNGSVNPNIPQISTCVLESIDLDYAPNGFAAYEVPGQTKPTTGGTGMPVAIRLSLAFKETEIMTKDNFKSGHNGGNENFNNLISKVFK